jgi:endonuclease/exonuclease/phosphatase (EEP) superfamily protein YafD
MRAFCLAVTLSATFIAAALSLTGAVSVRADVFNIAWPLKVFSGLAALVVLSSLRTPSWPLPRVMAMACAAGLVLTGLPWTMIRPPAGVPSAPEGAQSFTVTTFNAWASNTDPDSAETWLRASRSDVVALQEIGLNSGDLPGRLRDAYPFQHRCRWGVWLISRHALDEAGCSDQLPAVWARLVHDERAVTITGIHLARPLAPAWYEGHSKALEDLLARQSGPRIVLGDFNTGEGGFLMAQQDRRMSPLVRATSGLRTWPSKRLSPIPLIGIDHVWASPDLAASPAVTGPHIGSDHRPVSVGFTFRDAD